MATHAATCDRWVAVAMGKATKLLDGARIHPRGDAIFSYGSHFELARLIRDPKKGTPLLFLLNGDTFSVSTSQHQSHVRGAVAGAGIPSVTIPYSVLRSAGIDPDTVRLLDSTEDRHEVIEHTSWEQPAGSAWCEEAIYEYGPITDAEVEKILDKRYAEELDHYNRVKSYAEEEIAEGVTSLWVRAMEGREPPVRGTREQIPHWQLNRNHVIGHEMVLRGRGWANGHGRRYIVEDIDGRTRYRWTTTRHWLGEALITAKISWTESRPCRTCRGTGNGDWIGPLEEYVRHRVCLDCHGRSILSRRRSRTTKFLSGFDHNEPRPSYFFCELPRTKAVTLPEAYEALKPDTVRIAEQIGRPVQRQGDIFAVAMSGQLTKRKLRAAGARFEKQGRLLGTNHVATEVAYMPDGLTYARGVLHHSPGFRAPDHVRVRLNGKGFYLIQKNTVPLSA